MTDNTYNGWTNYATWRVNLEVFDGLSLKDIGIDLDIDNPNETYEIGEYIKDWAIDLLFDQECNKDSLVASYAMAFLSDVNWDEIAQFMIDEYKMEAL